MRRGRKVPMKGGKNMRAILDPLYGSITASRDAGRDATSSSEHARG